MPRHPRRVHRRALRALRPPGPRDRHRRRRRHHAAGHRCQPRHHAPCREPTSALMLPTIAPRQWRRLDSTQRTSARSRSDSTRTSRHPDRCTSTPRPYSRHGRYRWVPWRLSAPTAGASSTAASSSGPADQPIAAASIFLVEPTLHPPAPRDVLTGPLNEHVRPDQGLRGKALALYRSAGTVYRSFHRVPDRPEPDERGGPAMRGHVARKRDRFYAVIYEGLDPITGRERRTWHPAGTDLADAEALAARLAAERDGRNDAIRSLTFGAYLTGHWLPAKRLELRTSTYRSYAHKTERHILPALGRKRLRRLRPDDLERLYDSRLHPADGRRADQRLVAQPDRGPAPGAALLRARRHRPPVPRRAKPHDPPLHRLAKPQRPRPNGLRLTSTRRVHREMTQGWLCPRSS